LKSRVFQRWGGWGRPARGRLDMQATACCPTGWGNTVATGAGS